MDPDKCLEDMLRLASEILIACQDDPSDEATELAERVEALDEWLRKGGFLPKQWKDAQGNILSRVTVAKEVLDLEEKTPGGLPGTEAALLAILRAVLGDYKLEPSDATANEKSGLRLLRDLASAKYKSFWKFVKVSHI